MSRPDRQRKPAKKPDPNTRFNPMTGRREPIPKPKVGKNPLDVPQFPTNLPGPRDPRPLFPGSKRPEPPLLPSDFPDPPKGLPPVPDFVKQMEEQRKQAGLRQRLEEKKNKGRKDSAMRDATKRRRSRGGGRSLVFKDPANLRAYLSKQQGSGSGTVDSGKPQDMDDTIIKGDDGQTYRYDAEIDGFTPVKFDPAKNRFEFDDQGAGARQKAEADAAKERKDQQAAAMSESKSNFERQLADLRRMADEDPQFGTMYREFQDEYLSLMQDQQLRPEERDAALSDLYQRGTATFDATSGFRRAKEEAENKAKQEEQRAKAQEARDYRDRRAQEKFDTIRDEYSKKITQKEIEAASPDIKQMRDMYKSYADAEKDYGAEPMSYEDFYEQEKAKQGMEAQAARRMMSLERDVAIIDARIENIEEVTDRELRAEFTSLYGQTDQAGADKAFEQFKLQRDKDLADLRAKKIAKEGMIDELVQAPSEAQVAGSGERMKRRRAEEALKETEQTGFFGSLADRLPEVRLPDVSFDGFRPKVKFHEVKAAEGAGKTAERDMGMRESRQRSQLLMAEATAQNDPVDTYGQFADGDEISDTAPMANKQQMRGALRTLTGSGTKGRSSKKAMQTLRRNVEMQVNNSKKMQGLSESERAAEVDKRIEELVNHQKSINKQVTGKSIPRQ